MTRSKRRRKRTINNNNNNKDDDDGSSGSDSDSASLSASSSSSSSSSASSSDYQPTSKNKRLKKNRISATQPTISSNKNVVAEVRAELKKKKNRVKEVSKERQVNIMGDCIRYILFQHANGLPVTWDADFRAKAIQKRINNVRDKDGFFNELDHILKSTFGFTLKVLPKSQPSHNKKIKTLPPKSYVLQWDATDEEELLELNSLNDNISESALRGLILIISTCIFLDDGHMKEDKFWNTLEALSLYRHQIHHVFGNVDHLVNNLVRQKYLVKKKLDAELVTDDSVYEYLLGVRARVDFQNADMYTFACKIMNKHVDESDLNQIKLNQINAQKAIDEQWDKVLKTIQQQKLRKPKKNKLKVASSQPLPTTTTN